MLNDRGVVQVASPKGQDKLFTYDAAYDWNATQESLYDEMVTIELNYYFHYIYIYPNW